MIREAAVLVAVALSPVAHSADARNQGTISVVVEPRNNCPPDVDRYREWIASRPLPTGDRTPVAKEAIHGVIADRRADAVQLLGDKEIIALTDTQATDLIGTVVSSADPSATPYLIRNVVPSFAESLISSAIGLDRVGSNLVIRAGLFGCGGFLKNPLVVFLPFAPTRVDMNVSAIW